VGGQLHAASYGHVSAYGYDPIEKKPLYHFLPGSVIFSLGTVGCNLACAFCQNWQISQADAQTEYLAPADAARLGAGSSCGRCSVGVAYTYSEPLVWWEYVFDVARLVRERGLVNVLVTNGYVEEEPLRALLPLIDALNIDLKAFRDGFYREVCHGSLEPVKRTIEIAHQAGAHVELTTLVVPGRNDDPAEMEELARWIGALDRGIPLHLSRYFPGYRMREPGPTPTAVLVRLREVAGRHLDYVYVGNAFEAAAYDTFCPTCGAAVIRREGYAVNLAGLEGPRCRNCGRQVVARAG
jgi:pyruvate formate lyase activating enzyme